MMSLSTSSLVLALSCIPKAFLGRRFPLTFSQEILDLYLCHDSGGISRLSNYDSGRLRIEPGQDLIADGPGQRGQMFRGDDLPSVLADELLELMEIMDERLAVDLDPLPQAVLLLHECLQEKMSF